jgi:two-component system chemotaxis sensor kinase CheA
VRVSGQTIGLGVSAFGEGMEVILKPLEGMLAKIVGYAGTALLGDGRVLLILDLKELIR